MDAILHDWASFAVRWLHVTAAIAWIGSSFYFIALDLALVKRRGQPEGVKGEEWQVHGGGFYHIQKYLVAPAELPEHLTWFKWESYMTWISGFAMLVLVYYMQADLFLIDPSVAEISPLMGIVISLLSLAVAWIVYDVLSRSRLGHRPVALMVVLYVILVGFAWGYAQILSGRAALLHLGAITATIMTANVFFVIIPNQKVVVADLKAGRTPDPEFGRIAKLRSTHNNYLTLPVIFLMLSNHYPLAFATKWNWLIASLVFLMGVTIRHFFNTRHARAGSPWWTWAVTALLFSAIVALSVAGREGAAEEEGVAETTALHGEAARLAAAPVFKEVVDVVSSRCTMCHAAEPAWEGIPAAPRGVVLESEADIARHGRQIWLQAGITHAMPPANVAEMEPEERALIRRWFEESRS